MRHGHIGDYLDNFTNSHLSAKLLGKYLLDKGLTHIYPLYFVENFFPPQTWEIVTPSWKIFHLFLPENLRESIEEEKVPHSSDHYLDIPMPLPYVLTRKQGVIIKAGGYNDEGINSRG